MYLLQKAFVFRVRISSTKELLIFMTPAFE